MDLYTQIKEELLKTPFYSVLANNNNSEFGEYKVYEFKDTDFFEKLFERPPPSPATVKNVKAKMDCFYCGKQRCNRKKNVCCVCEEDFKTVDGLTTHDEEHFNCCICCICKDAQNEKLEVFKQHLKQCARKNGAKYVFSTYQIQIKSNQMSKRKAI